MIGRARACDGVPASRLISVGGFVAWVQPTDAGRGHPCGFDPPYRSALTANCADWPWPATHRPEPTEYDRRSVPPPVPCLVHPGRAVRPGRGRPSSAGATGGRPGAAQGARCPGSWTTPPGRPRAMPGPASAIGSWTKVDWDLRTFPVSPTRGTAASYQYKAGRSSSRSDEELWEPTEPSPLHAVAMYLSEAAQTARRDRSPAHLGRIDEWVRRGKVYRSTSSRTSPETCRLVRPDLVPDSLSGRATA